jgi:hypothetical protein
MFQSIKRIIPQSLQASGIESQVSASFVTTEAKKTLERLWGEERASYIEPVSFASGVLTIQISSPSAAQMLRMIETPWMNEINRAIGSRKVTKIQVKNR